MSLVPIRQVASRGSTTIPLPYSLPGVYGIYVGHGPSASLNESAGHLLRKKILGTDEGGVAAGYAYLSSPLLCDDDALEGHGPAAERDHSHHKSKRSRRA